MVPQPLWLSAFPKSGSTWLRFMLQHLIHGPPRSSQDVEHGMPSIHTEESGGWRAALQRGGIVLTHKSFAAQAAFHPRVDAFIQMVRHPADVVLSDAHFFALTQLDEKMAREKGTRSVEVVMRELGQLYLTTVLHYGKVPKQDRLGFGSWSENVGGWLEQRAHCPNILLRYEDLRADPVAQLERICTFLGLARSPDALRRAADGSSVAAMKAMQEREIQAELPGRFYNPRHRAAYQAGLRFVRTGGVGQSLLGDPAVVAKLEEHFGSGMQRLGYTFEAGAGAAQPLAPSLLQVRPLRS